MEGREGRKVGKEGREGERGEAQITGSRAEKEGELGTKLATGHLHECHVTSHLGLFIGGDDFGSTVHRGIVVLCLANPDTRN